MTNKIIFGADLIDVLENKYNMNQLANVSTKYKNGITTIDFIYGKEKDIDDLKYDKPYVEFSIDDETDGFISGTMYLNGGVEGTQFDSWEDLKYFMKNAKWTESKKSIKEEIDRPTWSKWVVKNIHHIEYFFNGKVVDKKMLNSLFESEGFDTNVDTVEDEIKKAVRSMRLGNLDSNALHIAHNSVGNRIDLVFDIGQLMGNVESLSNDECVIRINGGIYEQGEGMWNFGFAIYLTCDIHHFDFTLAESKNKSRKSLKEGINDELIATSSDGETTLYLSDERQANHGKDPHYEFKLGKNGYFTRYIRCDDNRCEKIVLDWIKEFDLDISKSEISKIIKLYESKKFTRKSMKEGKDSDFFNGIAKEYHFSKDEKTRYKDKTHISAIAVLFDRINNAIKTYGRNSDEEYNSLNDCWEAISSAKQNGFNVDYDEDRWNKIAGLPNYH